MRPTEFHLHFDQNTVIFDLVDHPVVTAWSYLLMGYWSDPAMYPEQINHGWTEETYAGAVGRMNAIADAVTMHFEPILGEALCSLMRKPDIDRDDLNRLHDGYERIQPILEAEPLNPFTPERILVAQSLNETIHYMERFFKNGTIYEVRRPMPRIRVRMLLEAFNWSAPVMMPYREEDFKLFELYRPGRLYLTYTKVGKPPLSIFRDQDDIAEEPKPWKLFGPSFNFTLFGPEPRNDFEEARAWLKQHTGRDDWVLGDPRIGDLRGDPQEIWERLGPDPKITDISFVYG